MTTVIDELIVTLGLDPKQFDAGRKKASLSLLGFKQDAEKQSKGVQQSIGQMGDVFAALQRRILAIAALFTGGKWMENLTRMNAELGYMGQRLGTSVQELGAWEAAGTRVGAKAGEIAGSIAAMRSALAGGQLHGVSSLQKFFMAMGIQPYSHDADGKLVMRNPTDILLEMSKWSQGQNPLIATQLFKEMGMAPGMISLLLQGPEVLKQYLKAAKEAAPTSDQVKKFQELQSAMAKASTEADKLGRLIGSALAGPLAKFFNATAKWLHDIQETDPKKIQKQSDDLHDELRKRFGNPSDYGLGGLQHWLMGDRFGHWKSTGGGTVPEGGGAAPSNGLPQSNKTSAAKKAAMEQLRKEGVPESHLDVAASLLVGQAMAESGLNPNAVHDHNTGYGVYGARLGRRDRMLAWLKANGYAKSSLEGQMKYMAHEAMTQYPEVRGALMTASPSTMGLGASILTTQFESPSVANTGTRLRYAIKALKTPIATDTAFAQGSSAVPFITPHPGLIPLQTLGDVSHNNTTSSTHIENLTVNSQTDSPWSHAADIKSALERNSAVNQSTYGAL